ncbi:MAG: class I SAM-dependent methyltransferase [Chloroflexi bacterium]|nr:class I SAM-dependent methyltransferase [Chloroflexota bacterium]
MPSSFDQWAEVYDSVYSYVTDDIPFYIDEARSAGGSVLELGCGTGRVAIPIAQAGIEIVGLDSSAAMLEVAGRKAQKAPGARGLRLVEADMRDFSLDEVFGLVIIPFRGFLSLLSVEDQIQALANVRAHLAPGGKLAFNIFVPDLNMLVQEGDVAYHLRDVTDSDTGRRLVVWHQSAYDNHNQIISARVIVDDLEADGVVGRRFYRDFQLRYSHRWEIRHLLEVCGFEIVDLFGDFERSPFDETSTEMVWVARAPG